MIVPKSFKNTYEEPPDRLRDLVKTALEDGELQQNSSRDRLLSDHELHVKLLSQGNLPTKNMILPVPYIPSRVSIQDAICRKIHLVDLKVESRDADTCILLRNITSPYIYSSTIMVVEDKNGDAARLTISNLEDTMVDPITPEGTLLAVKQPCWTRLADGGYHIRVDHPSDLTLLRSDDKLVPSAWRAVKEVDKSKNVTAWKKEGDMSFLKKQFRKALECYENGLAYLEMHPSLTSAIDLYRKKSGVNIILLRLDDAIKDLSSAILTHFSSLPAPSSPETLNPGAIEEWLRNHSTEDPLNIATSLPKGLKELAARIKFDLGIYSDTPTYDLSLISSYVGPLTLHVDAANYTLNTEVRQSEGHGRGMFAKRDFKVGDLICAEKAFVLPGYLIQDPSSDCLLYNLGDGTAAPRPGALLFKELVTKLKYNPSLRKAFFDLDDGGYWVENGYEINEDEEEIPVDVFRVEKIRRLNCFSLPTRSSDLLHQPPNSNPELRNGFWIHASYVNHSCLPNSVRTFIGDIHFLRATRDIAAGEEILHQYISPDIDIEERQEKLRGTWRFECDCTLCEVDGAVSRDGRQLRLKLFEELKASVMRLGEKGTTVTAVKKIARGYRQIEALYDEDVYKGLPRLALVHPSLFLTEAWRGVKNVDKTMEYARKLLRNFGILVKTEDGKLEIEDNAGIINVEGVRALKYLAEGHKSKGDEEISAQCLEVARTWYLIITGSEVGMSDFLKF
ncbi:hypothetical protein BDV96DRAFT_649151 [Lophiotrema nucula]|uniref:SET domain-containing protein n=1 Tax=Lophiotrema nucula TaxID=690887 RepID=A0A6A5YYW1_9PLEO|nr:hypothetical protein BDV96DRAFT_649151 [Lophiotrema nucula]